jgi:hypothetical protein
VAEILTRNYRVFFLFGGELQLVLFGSTPFILKSANIHFFEVQIYIFFEVLNIFGHRAVGPSRVAQDGKVTARCDWVGECKRKKTSSGGARIAIASHTPQTTPPRSPCSARPPARPDPTRRGHPPPLTTPSGRDARGGAELVGGAARPATRALGLAAPDPRRQVPPLPSFLPSFFPSVLPAASLAAAGPAWRDSPGWQVVAAGSGPARVSPAARCSVLGGF